MSIRIKELSPLLDLIWTGEDDMLYMCMSVCACVCTCVCVCVCV